MSVACIPVLVGCAGNGSVDPPRYEGGPLHLVVETVGGPVTHTGALEPLSTSIQVLGQEGDVIRFDDERRLDPDGAQDRLELPVGVSTVELTLVEGERYTLQAEASDKDGNLLAWGVATVNDAESPSSIALDRSAILGEASLFPRLPVRSVLPGQSVDLMFTVSPPARGDLIVPYTDFAAYYVGSNGAIVASSERGARVEAGPPSSGDLVVDATASGLRLRDERVGDGTVSARITIPFSRSLQVDFTPPVIEQVDFLPKQRSLEGLAHDNLGIAELEIFDGPVLLATTDLEVVATKGVAAITFPGGGTRFHTQLELPSETVSLTVIAHDFTGNESRADIEIDPESY